MKVTGGRKCDVLIEPYPMMDRQTGLKWFADDEFILWADEGMKDIVKLVEGVSSVSDYGTHYFVKIDRRYDMAHVQEEVKAAILCRNS